MRTTFLLAAVSALAAVNADTSLPPPVYQGCYNATTLKFQGTSIYQSMNECQKLCVPLGASVEATYNTKYCSCGNVVPPDSDKVDDSMCDTACNGFPSEKCGGANTFSVYLTTVGKVDTSPSDTSSSSSSSSASSSSSTATSAPASTVVIGGPTVSATTSVQPTNTGSPSSSPNKAAIAAGVVVGLLAVIAAVSGGAFLYRRRQRNRQVEEEYRRNAANSSFGAGSKPNSGSSFSDTRLDPTVMAQRRMSDGSIADNQDYSRRILKVTNA